MIKSQQCTKCYGMFNSKDGKHDPHTDEKTNITKKGTKQEWVCFGCRGEKEGRTKK